MLIGSTGNGRCLLLRSAARLALAIGVLVLTGQIELARLCCQLCGRDVHRRALARH